MNYTTMRMPISTGLDENGIHLGLTRIDGETLWNYQRRLILETREPSGPTQIEFIRSLSRRVGVFDTPVLRIDLIRDGDGEPLAVDPHIDITSSHLRVYDDHANGSLDVELNFYDRAAGYFLRDVYTAINASSFFNIEILDDEYEFKLSQKLRYDTTQRHVPSELLRSSRENKLDNDLLIAIYPRARTIFTNEENTLAGVDASGDYYVDYTSGVLFTYDPQGSFISYTYREFPFTLWHQAVRCYPYRDEDKKYFHKSGLISDSTGEVEYVSLNSEGAEVANTVLAVHPLTWGH